MDLTILPLSLCKATITIFLKLNDNHVTLLLKNLQGLPKSPHSIGDTVY